MSKGKFSRLIYSLYLFTAFPCSNEVKGISKLLNRIRETVLILMLYVVTGMMIVWVFWNRNIFFLVNLFWVFHGIVQIIILRLLLFKRKKLWIIIDELEEYLKQNHALHLKKLDFAFYFGWVSMLFSVPFQINIGLKICNEEGNSNFIVDGIAFKLTSLIGSILYNIFQLGFYTFIPLFIACASLVLRMKYEALLKDFHDCKSWSKLIKSLIQVRKNHLELRKFHCKFNSVFQWIVLLFYADFVLKISNQAGIAVFVRLTDLADPIMFHRLPILEFTLISFFSWELLNVGESYKGLNLILENIDRQNFGFQILLLKQQIIFPEMGISVAGCFIVNGKFLISIIGGICTYTLFFCEFYPILHNMDFETL